MENSRANEGAIMQPKIVKQMSIDAQVLMERLRTVPVGHTVTYDEMSDHLGRDITKDRGALQTARRRLLIDERICFAAVFGAGLKRLGDTEKVGVAGSYIVAARRATKRGLTVLASAEYDSLDADGQRRHNTLASHLGVLAQVTTSAAQKKIAERVIGNNSGKIPSAIALEALK